MRLVRRLPAALLWPALPLLYLLLPGHPLGRLDGLPWDNLELGLALVVTLTAWCGVRPSARLGRVFGAILLGACLLKLVLAGAALPYGLVAAYRTSADPSQPPERSTEWRLPEATRVDPVIDFAGDRFPLHFFNDLRFNYYKPSQPRRDLLPFSVTWRGYLDIPAAGEYCFTLQANGGASLALAGLPTATIQRANHVEAREVCGALERGPAPLTVQYTRQEGSVPRVALLAGRTEEGVPLAADRLFRAPVAPEAAARDRALGGLAQELDATFILACGALVVAAVRRRLLAAGLPRTVAAWERPLLALAVLGALLEGLAVHRHFAGRTPLLSGGNDWLAYESFARDILLNGPLMTGGKPLGEGEPYYYQPLYAYFLAGLHLLLGESVYGVLLAQYVLVALAGVLTYLLARELFGRRAAVGAFALFWILRYLIFNQVAGLLLSENLVAVLVPASLLALVRWERAAGPPPKGASWHSPALIGGGVLLGLAILTRSTPLLFLPPALLVIALAARRAYGGWRPALASAGVLLVATLAVFSLAPLRNQLVAGRPVLLPESATTNIDLVHRPTAKVDLSKIDRNPLYNRLGLDQRTREVLEFIRQDPLGYAATLVPMGLYALGITGPALGTPQVQYELVALSALYAGGSLLAPARARPVWLLHAFILTHFLQMMVFMSHQYGFRLPLPMYGPMTVIAGLAALTMLASAWRRLDARARATQPWWRAVRWTRAESTLLAALALAAGCWTLWEFARPRAVEETVFGLGGDAGAAARVVAASPIAWQADRIYFAGRDQRSLSVAYLPGLAYRDMKWIDLSQAVVWPAEDKHGLLVYRAGATGPLADCWRAPFGSEQRGDDPRLQWLPLATERRCVPTARRLASFAGLLELIEAQTVPSASNGPLVRVVWRIVQRPIFDVALVVEQLDPRENVIAQRQFTPYPAAFWEPGETVVATLPLPPAPEQHRLAVGFARDGASRRLTIDDPLPLYGQSRWLIPATAAAGTTGR